MGCLFSKCLQKPKLESEPSNPVSLADLVRNEYLEPVPLTQPPTPPPSTLPSSPSEEQAQVDLYHRIYVATKTYQHTDDNHLSFEKGDEFEYIKDISPTEFLLNHLRTGQSGHVLKSFVIEDVSTPLRLAIVDRGIIQQCLMQHNVPGGYLIRRSSSNPNDYVLSISQYNDEHHTFDWHYLISIHPTTHCFYFSHESLLKDLHFRSFQQLIQDSYVRKLIPLTEILPFTIEFEEDVWKIPFDKLTLKSKIGEGHFGEVFHANWRKGHTTISVAVKKLRIQSVTNIVEQEIDAMKRLRNIYIVALYGISQNPITNEILIVTELMEKGDLKSWLKRCPQFPENAILLRFAKDIASGMSYLEYRNYVHRDLACRNILLGPKENFVKITDFGLATIIKQNDFDQRERAQAEKLPVRWLAPELLDNQSNYSIKSDVWSFGILLIELWLKGNDPYEDEHLTWIYAAVSTGYVHKKPEKCPENIYEMIICQCLNFNANDRPSFSNLRQSFEKLLRDTVI